MIPVVRLHPYGGYAVVQMEHAAAGAPHVTPGYHDRILNFRAACVAAEGEDRGDYLVHPECQ